MQPGHPRSLIHYFHKVRLLPASSPISSMTPDRRCMFPPLSGLERFYSSLPLASTSGRGSWFLGWQRFHQEGNEKMAEQNEKSSKTFANTSRREIQKMMARQSIRRRMANKI